MSLEVWEEEFQFTAAGPRGTGITSPPTGVYNFVCTKALRHPAEGSRNGSIELYLQITDDSAKGMVLRHRIWESDANETVDWKRDGFTKDMKAALISLGHPAAQVNAIANKRQKLSNTMFVGKAGTVYVEAPNQALGHDFPRLLMIGAEIGAEIKSGARTVAPKHDKPKKGFAGAGAAPALGGGGGELGGGASNINPAALDLGGGDLGAAPNSGAADALGALLNK